MPMTPEQAKEWAFKNSKYFKLKDGESFTARLKDMKPITSRFNPEKEVIRYTFELPDGSIKFFENGSGVLLAQMTSLVGKDIQVTREGEKTETKYEVFLAE
jgi:hypothetical protein